MNLGGKWYNAYGSEMDLDVDGKGLVRGVYKTQTSPTIGIYRLVGLTDPAPEGESQTVGFTVFWAKEDENLHTVNTFAGQLQVIDGEEVLTTTYFYVTPTKPEKNWSSTIIDKLIFKRKPLPWK